MEIRFFCPTCKQEVQERQIGKKCPNCTNKVKRDEVLFSLTTK